MQTKRTLIIIYEKFVLQFLLFETDHSSIRLIKEKKVRNYTEGYKFFIVDFILQSLTLWGEECGLIFVQEMVPLVPRVGNHGMDEIHIFSYRKDESLYSITKNVFVIGNDIKPQGTVSISKLVDFQNILYIGFDFDKIEVVRYIKDDGRSVKVMSEIISYDAHTIASSKEFTNILERIETDLVTNQISDFLANSLNRPLFELQSSTGILVDFLLSVKELETIRLKSKKLGLHLFGKDKLGKDLVIIGGEKLRILNNVSLLLLEVLTVLSLSGTVTVYCDKFGFFDLLQKSKTEIMSKEFYSQFLLELWGNCVIVSNKKKAKWDETVARVRIQDGDVKKEMIPLYGHILKFSFSDGGSFQMDTYEGYFVGKETQMMLKNAQTNVVIDARPHPIDLSLVDTDELFIWLKGIGAISN